MKLSKKIQEQAQTLIKDNGFKEVIVNKKGEFFTVMGLALMSVEGDKSLVATVSYEDKDLEAEYEKKESALENCINELEGIKSSSTEALPQEEIDNNQVIQTKLENRIKDLKIEVEELSNQLKPE